MYSHEDSAVGCMRDLVAYEAAWRQNDTDRNMIKDYWVADVSGMHRVMDLGGNPVDEVHADVAKADYRPIPADNTEGHVPKVGPMLVEIDTQGKAIPVAKSPSAI